MAAPRFVVPVSHPPLMCCVHAGFPDESLQIIPYPDIPGQPLCDFRAHTRVPTLPW